MSLELHHLNTHGMMEQAGNVLDGVVRLKARIAELEKENAELRSKNEGLLYALADAETELEEERRWRKFSEELPPTDGSYMCAYKNKNKDDGVLFVDEAVWDGEKWSSKFDFWEDIIYWQFKPKAPKEDK